MTHFTLPQSGTSTRRAPAPTRLPLVAASADQRGFLVIYERPGVQLNLADVYEFAGIAVVG